MSSIAMYDKGIALKGWMHAKQIIVNGQKLTKRNCRTWVQCPKCGTDIKATDKGKWYWETPGRYRLCIKCMLDHIQQTDGIVEILD